MKDNILYIPDMLQLAQRLEVDMKFIDFIPTGRGSLKQCPSAEELRFTYNYIKSYARNNSSISIAYPNKITAMLDESSGENHFLTLLKMLNTECNMMCEACTVMAHSRANGDVLPCVYFREKEFICGNIFQDDFKDIWENSNVMQEFRQLGALPSTCKSCKSKETCMGGCRAYAYYASGGRKLDAFDQRCWRKTNVYEG